MVMVIRNSDFIPDVNTSLCTTYRCCCSYKWLCSIIGLISSVFSISNGRTSVVKISECTQHYNGTVAFIS